MTTKQPQLFCVIVISYRCSLQIWVIKLPACILTMPYSDKAVLFIRSFLFNHNSKR